MLCFSASNHSWHQRRRMVGKEEKEEEEEMEEEEEEEEMKEGSFIAVCALVFFCRQADNWSRVGLPA